jgi:hypothetical protein
VGPGSEHIQLPILIMNFHMIQGTVLQLHPRYFFVTILIIFGNLCNRQMLVGGGHVLKSLLDCRQCKNITMSLQSKIYFVSTYYLPIFLLTKEMSK